MSQRDSVIVKFFEKICRDYDMYGAGDGFSILRQKECATKFVEGPTGFTDDFTDDFTAVTTTAAFITNC